MEKYEIMQKKLVCENFNNILVMVKNGENITDAIRKKGINRFTFYKNISGEQKTLLRINKALNAKAYIKRGLNEQYMFEYNENFN